MPQDVTRLIIPAPTETRRDTGVTWYEARLDSDKRTAIVEAFADKDNKKAEATIQLRPYGAFTTIINDDIEVTIEAQVARDNSGKVRIQGQVNGRQFELSEQLGGLDPSARPEVSVAEREILERWGRLADSFEALAHATRQSWGVVACSLLYLGIGCSAAECVGTAGAALPACGAALVGSALAVENCGDL